MNIINIEHISKIFGEKVIFEDASFGIQQGDKIGIVGINGTGKSTVLRMIAGEEEPDQGQNGKDNQNPVRNQVTGGCGLCPLLPLICYFEFLLVNPHRFQKNRDNQIGGKDGIYNLAPAQIPDIGAQIPHRYTAAHI